MARFPLVSKEGRPGLFAFGVNVRGFFALGINVRFMDPRPRSELDPQGRYHRLEYRVTLGTACVSFVAISVLAVLAMLATLPKLVPLGW